MRGSSHNRIEKRLAEIERDLSRVRRMERAIRAGRIKSDSAEEPGARPTGTPAPFSAVPPKPEIEEPASAKTASSPPFARRETDPDLFSHAALRGSMNSASGDFKQDRKRFASYLTSGGLLGLNPLRQDRTHLRNRALVMIVVVILVAFSLYRVFFRAGPSPDSPPPAMESTP